MIQVNEATAEDQTEAEEAGGSSGAVEGDSEESETANHDKESKSINEES